MADKDLEELDVRQLRKPDKHPTIFTAYAALAVGESFVLVNNHDPKHLRAEFDIDHPGSYDWDYESALINPSAPAGTPSSYSDSGSAQCHGGQDGNAQ